MSQSSPLHQLGAVEIGRRIAARTLTSVEVTQRLLERIARLDTRLASYATVTAEAALAAARERDREVAAGQVRGPLHGVPVAVKDLCDTAGVVTAAGTTIHRERVPARDATVVTRLRAAGAVLLGKLQMTEGAFSAHHPAIKAPVNPWSAAHWTGVSSSGSGVATAACLCFASLGSDTLGSIRFPSTMNGLTGLKPTWGRVSRAGVFPLAESLDHVGPMARNAMDAAAMLQAIAGADPDDPTAAQEAVPDYLAALEGGVAAFRIGIDRGFIAERADADMQRAVFEAAEVFARLGATLVDIRLPDMEHLPMDATLLAASEVAVAHESTFPACAAEYGPVLTALIESGRRLDSAALTKILLRRAAFRGRMNTLLAGIDLLLQPAMNQAAPTLTELAAQAATPEKRFARVIFTAPLDMSGHPSLTLPGGATPEGMPAGFQIIGRHFDEARVLAAGHAYQGATQWHLRRPPDIDA